MKEHFSSRVTKLLVILALAVVASVMFVIVGCGHTHSWTKTSESAATCTANGIITYTCEDCGEVRQEQTQATGHKWEVVETTEATCNTPAYTLRKCSVCGETSTLETSPATGRHDYKGTVVAPTCTERGYTIMECSYCGDRYIDESSYVAALGHKWVKGTPVAVTCTTDGYTPATCSVCNATEKQDIVKATGHIDDTTVGNKVVNFICEVDETLTAAINDGKDYAFKCAVCKQNIEAQDHDPVQAGAALCIPNAQVTAEAWAAGYDKSTYYAFECKTCEKYIAVGDHSNVLMTLTGVDEDGEKIFELADADAAKTCKTYWVCEYCGKEEMAGTHVSPRTTGQTELYANCEHGDLCTVCGTEMTAALPHKMDADNNFTGTDGKFGNFTGNVEYTCATDGYTYTYCTACKERQATEEVEWKVRYETKNGTRTLVNADGNYDVVVTAAQHTYDDPDNNYDGTRVPIKPDALDPDKVNCVTGYTTRDICLKCGATRIEVKPATEPGKPAPQEPARGWTNEKGDIQKTRDSHNQLTTQQPQDHTLIVVEPGMAGYNDQFTDKNYEAPTCVSTGSVLHYCTTCHENVWAPADSKNPNNHAAPEEMVGCGHNYCSACNNGLHNVQYSISFVVTLNGEYKNIVNPTIDTFYGYACLSDAENVANQTKFFAELNADEAFEYEYYTDAEMSEPWTTAGVGEPGADGEPYNKELTVYVKATPKVAFTVTFDVNNVLEPTDVPKVDPITVYVAQADKSVNAPAITGYTVRYYTDSTLQEVFDFTLYDWDEVAVGSTVSIYVLVS